MNKINTDCLYEILKYVTFTDMNNLRISSKCYNKKVEIVMIILSEREANRILLASNNLLRNPFVDKEEPKQVLANLSWYEFLIEQVKRRWRIKRKLYNTISNIFEESDKSFIIKMTNLMFQEIKKKRPQKNVLKKEESLYNFQTEFQELMLLHSQHKNSDKYPRKVMTSQMDKMALAKQSDFVEEIINKNEVQLFNVFRWYKNYQEDETVLPQSTLLSFLFWIDEFLTNHCMSICKSIESKCTDETFLDEYGTRWISYTSLIEIFETEFKFIEDLVNNIYEDDRIAKELPDRRTEGLKFSFLRMMCRIWGKYVMKNLFDKFSDKVTAILVNYQDKLLKLVEDFYELKKTKSYFLKYLDNEFWFSKLQSQVLKQALQMVLDLSINEYSVKHIDNSKVELSIFYPKLEEKIMKVTKPFLKKIFKKCSQETFEIVTKLYMRSLNSILIVRSRRRLHNLVYATIWLNTENTIKKHYLEFSINHYENKSRMSEDDEECKARLIPAIPMRPRARQSTKSTFAMKAESDTEPEVTPVGTIKSKEQKIVDFIQNIIKKQYLKGRNSKLLRKNTHSMELVSSVDDYEEEGKLKESYHKTTQKFLDFTNEEWDDVENEPKINLIRCTGSLASPFIKVANPIIMPSPKEKKGSVNEKELSLQFYKFATKNHKDLFDNLKFSYQKWREGIEKFDKKDSELGQFNSSKKNKKKELSPKILQEDNLFRHFSTRDPFYDNYQPNYEDIYYENFNENDIELRDFLLDEQEESDDDFDMDMDDDFGNWL